MNMLEISKISKIYEGKVSCQALKLIDFIVPKGQFVGVMGPSGSGKTTLLNVVSTIDHPTTGAVVINGKEPHQLPSEQLAVFRRRELGFVFQDFNLLHTLTLRENIFLPLALDGVAVRKMNERLNAIAPILGITDILDKRTYEISGGQVQRAAIARAIIHEPALVLADEPTGNLDIKSSRAVMELLRNINREMGATILTVTHDPTAASYCDRIIFIRDGSIYNEIYRGEHQNDFYGNIMEVLSFMGGDSRDFSTIRN
ncbi:ABC transporter ATP-binding protein [Paenibacillus sp. ACRRX]|uniref:ABC transporter ATP-binding protein n=1 Tax=Paenibacillus sp. ACRRX TaxID=2918206 RepID=UPI001EF4F472|nr:ABC transporter ATP-binding protein [Paenibacillus sp. ACRRX]MCG7409505.1 ABC transporter ATP-binding protein [Paenibacillus sp. ACRRX]